ncbi:hypothetical protein HK096_008544, partial [Nowakowskiella sp. JEL0078]
IPAGKTYMIGSQLSFTGCSNCDFQIEGTLKVTNDVTFWGTQRSVFAMNAITNAKVRSLTGTGLIDGNGQAAWDAFAADSTISRATLFEIDGSSSGITVSNLYFKNAPNVFHSVRGNSKNILYTDIILSAVSSSSNLPKNTDGWDIGASTFVTLKNVTVKNDDDCVAFKPGSNYVTIDTITCEGSHGISVGSLGKGAGSTDTVQNVYVTKAIMKDSTKAVGIKLYPGGSAHGISSVKNVTFDGVTVSNCDYAAQIQSCYGETTSYCASNPSTSSIQSVYFKNFKGTTSSKYNPTVSNLNCPASGICDIYFSSFSVLAPSGKSVNLCANIDSTPGITCSSGASG